MEASVAKSATYAGTFGQRTRAIKRTFGAAEWLLYLFSGDPVALFRPPGAQQPTEQWTTETALSYLEAAFPDLMEIIAGKRVLDYGCGDGFQAVAMARSGASHVQGADINEKRLRHGRAMAEGLTNISFDTKPATDFDVAISLNSFEHFLHPEENLQQLIDAVRPGGKILIAFSSFWLSPWGSHMNFFTKVPWVNILFPESAVHKVRSLYRDDGSKTYLPGINKMTVARFERIVVDSGLRIKRLQYRAVKGLPVTGIPILRELLVNNVSCILEKR